MASNRDEQDSSSTVVPTMALLAFIEAALALVNAGVPYLPSDELEHISVHLEHATAIAIREARARRAGSLPISPLLANPCSASAVALPTPPATLKADVSALEAQVQSLYLQSWNFLSFFLIADHIL